MEFILVETQKHKQIFLSISRKVYINIPQYRVGEEEIVSEFIYKTTKYNNNIKLFRFTEIAVLPEYRKKRVELALIIKLMEYLKKNNYTDCEGGFIFEENRDSINLSTRFAARVFNTNVKPHKRYAIFEDTLL